MMAGHEQHLCNYCSKVNNLVLRGPEETENVLGLSQTASYLGLPGFRKSRTAESPPSISYYFGPTLGTALKQQNTCVLCRAIVQVLGVSPATDDGLDRRVALRFVTKSGYTSDGRSTWNLGDEQALKRHASADSIRLEKQYGIAGIGVDLETVAGSGIIPEVAKAGLQLFKPANLINQRTQSEATQKVLKELDQACPRTESEASISSEVIQLVQKWLTDCLENHSKDKRLQCDQTLSGQRLSEGSALLPTRLIAVNPESSPRLVETKGTTGEYLALSYRWGTGIDDIWRLKQANLEESLQQLPFPSLPYTIRDAITLTRQLGFEYLWIDSCCIIQDDSDDWAREAATMQAVYQNATMVIAILGDRDSNSGFLNRVMLEPAIKIPWLDNDGNQVSTVFASSRFPFRKPEDRNECLTDLDQELDQTPWSTRAWTFQEQMLSRRTLYFGSNQLYFECRKEQRSETGFDEIVKTNTPRQLLMDTLESDFTTAFSNYMKNSEQDSTPAWISNIMTKAHDPVMRIQRKYFNFDIAQTKVNIDSLLHDYTSRSLSYQSDKLIAFEGLANAIASRTGQEFQAGLWTNKTAKSLFWWLANGPEERDPRLRAPTWSWACRNGRINGYDTEMVTNDDMRAERKHADRGGFDGALDEVEVLHSNFLVVDQPGARSVSLRLRAQCLTVSCSVERAFSFPRTWKQLKEDIKLWSSANSSWDPEHSHILFAPVQKPDEKKGQQVRKVQVMQKCLQCRRSFQGMDEHRSLSHLERCTKDNPAEDHAYSGSLEALVGAAYFDNPHEVPESFKCILLWRARAINMFYTKGSLIANTFRKGAHITTTSGAYRDRHGWTELRRSETEILGFEGHRVNVSLDDVGSGPAFIHKTNPRLFFFLLIQPTQVEGTYKRCGVALGYFIDGAEGSNGLPLHLYCAEEELVLV